MIGSIVLPLASVDGNVIDNVLYLFSKENCTVDLKESLTVGGAFNGCTPVHDVLSL
jgi:hypothetical protein